ncbi:uncharacterized protein [Typha angustifolia]|uniref:uncharacterized protein n=1 Tax=Typha angustifolia TaxID=59011 RepID=UPI003C2C8837
MAESACVFRDSSHAPETSNGERKMNPLAALADSVSFGRFLSESLDWGKWSSFNHNKYLEDVEKYSRPGSVAQKKAYFEAHYKKIAARKAAALEEQANAITNESFMESSDIKVESEELSSEVDANKVQDVEVAAAVSTNSCDLNEESHGLEVEKLQDDHPIDLPLQVGSLDMVDNVENQNSNCEVETGRIPTSEKQPFKESFVTNQEHSDKVEKKRRVPISESSLVNRHSPASKHQSSLNWMKNNSSTPNNRSKRGESLNEKMRSTPNLMHMSIDLKSAHVGTSTPSRTKSSSVVAKIQAFEAASKPSKPFKNNYIQLKTLTMASSKGIPKPVPGTPESGHGRSRPLSELTLSGRKSAAAEQHTFSFDYSKSMSTTERRLKSKVNSPFIRPKTDAIAEKCKEDKAESELREYRQSLCFKARPLPNFYCKSEAEKDANKKIISPHPQSPIPGRKSNSRANLDRSPLPGLKPFCKNSKSTFVMKGLGRTNQTLDSFSKNHS